MTRKLYSSRSVTVKLGGRGWSGRERHMKILYSLKPSPSLEEEDNIKMLSDDREANKECAVVKISK
jgi:hypothetical protein